MMLLHHTMFNTLYSPLVRVEQGIRLMCSHHTLFRPSLQACTSGRRKIYISICHPHIPSFIIDAPWNLNHLIGLISRVSFTFSGQCLLCSDRQTVSPTYRRKSKHVITETFLLTCLLTFFSGKLKAKQFTNITLCFATAF